MLIFVVLWFGIDSVLCEMVVLTLCVDYIMAIKCIGTICAAEGKEVVALRALRVNKNELLFTFYSIDQLFVV
jgi:ABC-type nitrate/sulfonate/bicarbonate transport system permease component